jgi:hypothetical protein
LKAGRLWGRAREAVGRRRSVARGAFIGLEVLAALITIAVVAVGLINHFGASGTTELPGEGKRIVAFQQVANRICTEHRNNVRRAFAEAPNRIERLGYLSRAIGWDINDLESITPPPARAMDFQEEISVRRHTGPELLALQRAIELHRLGEEAKVFATLQVLEVRSRELSRAAGIVRCMQILPPASLLIRR